MRLQEKRTESGYQILDERNCTAAVADQQRDQDRQHDNRKGDSRGDANESSNTARYSYGAG